MLRSTLKLLVLLASFSFLAACGGDDGGGGADCTDMAAQMRGSMVIATTCTNCHSSTLEGAERMSAPVGVNFDSAAGIDQYDNQIVARAVDNVPSPMPPTGPLSAAQKSDVEAFIECR